LPDFVAVVPEEEAMPLIYKTTGISSDIYILK